VHTDCYPASMYFISLSDFIMYDADENVLLDSRSLEKMPSPDSVVWSSPLPVYALENVGKNDLRAISVEIKII